MSQSLQKQIPLAERGHRVFDMVRKFARGAEEIEISLISTTGEYLRFGNNELGQSQSTKNRTLSVRLIRQEASTDNHRPSRRELHPEGSRESCLAAEDLSR